jgi:hypothetical protein
MSWNIVINSMNMKIFSFIACVIPTKYKTDVLRSRLAQNCRGPALFFLFSCCSISTMSPFSYFSFFPPYSPPFYYPFRHYSLLVLRPFFFTTFSCSFSFQIPFVLFLFMFATSSSPHYFQSPSSLVFSYSVECKNLTADCWLLDLHDQLQLLVASITSSIYILTTVFQLQLIHYSTVTVTWGDFAPAFKSVFSW